MSNIYKLDEMLDSIKQSIETVRTVIRQQEKLLDVLKDNEDEDFKDFKTGMADQTEEYKKQLEALTIQSMELSTVIDKIKAKSEIEEIVSDLLAALRIVEE